MAASRLVPHDTPFLGHMLQVDIFDLPIDIALMAMGWQRLQNPVPLDVIGMPGCMQHITLDAAVIVTGFDNHATWSLQIPDIASLRGVEFYNQAIALDPAAGNGLSAVVSEAAHAVVGEL